MSFSDFFEAQETSLDDASDRLKENMDMLKSMPVQEQTLYKKYKEIKGKYAKTVDSSRVVKAKIWTPTDIHNRELTVQEISNMQPRIRYAHSKEDLLDWLMLRVFSHTMQFDQNPGRFLRFLVYDDVTKKYLGAVSLGSDVISISCRDQWIGWEKDIKLGGKLNNTSIGTCIMATQPFGYNFLGGKLVASMLTTQVVADTWEKLYNNVLAGLTTTSLYGSASMYNSIPFWKKLGRSKGSISIKPDDQIYNEWHQIVKEQESEWYDREIHGKQQKSGPPTGVKQKTISKIFKLAGIKESQYKHGFERGVYFARRYENTREFLRGEITKEQLIPLGKLENDVDSIVDWWKPKAIRRYEKLHEENRINDQILFYNNMIDMSWDKAKQTYIGDVGR
jgi:hypothetical protein|tara:strand:- start:683 stop:1858 length:1176 start_codon:yes stop_codon:yes gene_type:complete